MESKQCKQCGKVFYKTCQSKKVWENRVKFCSRECANKGKIYRLDILKKVGFKKGIQNNPNGGFAKGHQPWNTGKKFEQVSGEKNVNWKGDQASYTAIHIWVGGNFKKTGICEKCQTKPTRKNSKFGTEWANKDKKYTRNREDWMELCAKCHDEYDQNGIRMIVDRNNA